MVSYLQVQPVTSRRDLRDFILFPWRVYRDDPNWVPPLISDQFNKLDPIKGSFYQDAEVGLFLARQDRQVVGSIAAFIDHKRTANLAQPVGSFGFFEAIDEYDVAEALLDAAVDWMYERNISMMSGPTNFTEHECPGVLVEGANCPPVMLAAHTPLYYKDLLESYGMEKDHDLYAWRAFRSQIGEELQNIPSELNRVADVAHRLANVTLRKIRLENWETEITAAHRLFNDTLSHLPDFVPTSESDFRRLANQMRSFIDPDIALFAEVDGNPIGFCIALPDINRVLIHLNGRLFPFGWIKAIRLVNQIDVVSFKLMGILDEYRRRGIDALLYLETVKAFYKKGYSWLDGSITSEYNPMINLLANRLGAERYKHYRLYQLKL